MEARQLLRRARLGALGTVSRQGGAPYVSAANLATDPQGRPLIFVSRLAWHTQNLLEDARASVMASELPAEGDALTGARVTVLGRFAKVEDEELRARYAARHPAARMYLDFSDFGFWRLEPETIHAVAGFGRIETLEPTEVFLDAARTVEISALAAGAAEHVNADHADAVARYAGEPGQWKVTAIDCDGYFIEHAERVKRITFDKPVFTAGELRRGFAKPVERP